MRRNKTEKNWMMPKGAKFWTDYSGELMQPDLTEENRLDIWLEAKTMKEGVAGEELQAVKDKIGNTTVVDMDEKKTIRFKYNRYTPPTLFLVFVNKNIAVLLNPCTLLSLQVDVRSTNGIKVGGLKPLITYQYDRLTQIRAGASFLPGVSALIVGCKRDIGSGLTLNFQLDQDIRPQIHNSSSLAMDLLMWGTVKPFIVYQKGQARGGVRAARDLKNGLSIHGGMDALARKELELYKAYLRCEYSLPKGFNLFLAAENYFKMSTRLRFGVSIPCWQSIKLKVGLENRGTAARAFVGVEFKECSLNVGFSDILQNVVKDKRNFILIAVSLAIGFAGYKLAQYFGKEEEKPAEDEERYKISSDMEILIKPKSLEKYEHEVGVKGLMVEEAWFGERRLLEEYIVARDSGTAERGDWSQLRDVRVPFRFWTDKSALRLSSGYKPFLYRNAEKLENPYILLIYRAGDSDETILLLKETEEINLQPTLNKVRN